MKDKRARVVRCIRTLPAGTVSSYGALAKAAGWPGAARQVVRILHQVPGLAWHRVVGSGGAIKLCGEQAAEQTKIPPAHGGRDLPRGARGYETARVSLFESETCTQQVGGRRICALVTVLTPLFHTSG